jgi:hypothetical protein
MNTEDIKKTIEKALSYLETVDCNTLNRAIMTSNSKKVHKAYDLLFELKNKILGGY